MKALEKIKWLKDVFVTRREEQYFEVDSSIKTAFNEAIAELEALQSTHEARLKAKDEKIRKLNNTYANVVCDFESAVMEIKRLMEANEVIDAYEEVQCQMTP